MFSITLSVVLALMKILRILRKKPIAKKKDDKRITFAKGKGYKFILSSACCRVTMRCFTSISANIRSHLSLFCLHWVTYIHYSWWKSEHLKKLYSPKGKVWIINQKFCRPRIIESDRSRSKFLNFINRITNTEIKRSWRTSFVFQDTNTRHQRSAKRTRSYVHVTFKNG